MGQHVKWVNEWIEQLNGKLNLNILQEKLNRTKLKLMITIQYNIISLQSCLKNNVSVSKTTRELLLEWNKKNPVDLSSDLKMPQFTMGSVITDNCEESSLIGNIFLTSIYALGFNLDTKINLCCKRI